MSRIAITGTSRGLGRALAEELSALGHQVHGGGRTSLEALGFTPAGSYHPLDVTDSASQQHWFDSFPELPDIVVANAGLINANRPLWEVPEEEFRSVLEVNVTGVFLTLKTFMERLTDQKNRLFVALSSTWGRSVSADVAPYCASKWAVEGMIKALAQEVPSHLTVVALNPGVIATDMLRSCFGPSAESYCTPEQWARQAAPQILGYGPQDNGRSLTI